MITKLLVAFLVFIPTLSQAQDCFKLELEMDFIAVERALAVDLATYKSDWKAKMDIENDVSRHYLVMKDFIPEGSTDFNESAVTFYDMGIMQLAFYGKKLITIRSKHAADCDIVDSTSLYYGSPTEIDTIEEDEEDKHGGAKPETKICLVWSTKNEVVLFYNQELIKMARRSIPPVEVVSISVMDVNGKEL